jgi:fibro-slime domain-containing protein
MKFSSTTRSVLALAGLALGVVVLSMIKASTPAQSVARPTTTGAATSTDPYADLSPTMDLIATIRDFKGKSEAGGHPDFEAFGNNTARIGLVKDTLDADGKPVMNTTAGKGDITTEYLDALGHAIPPFLYADANLVSAVRAAGDGRNTSYNDTKGVVTHRTGAMLTSAQRFSQWYRDIPGVNASTALKITLTRQPNTNRYLFDSAVDAPYKARGGFFPIDGQLYGNFGSYGHNFHFTTEVQADFVYEAGKGQLFRFTGDDDVWVFIDNKLVLDLGGLHPKREQWLELDRIPWLENNGVYTMKIFHAERHTTESNFRIETTIKFRKVEPPPTGSLAD